MECPPNIPAALAAYDQFDAGVRDAWHTLTPEIVENLTRVAERLKDTTVLMEKITSCLLIWAITTMHKRDLEEKAGQFEQTTDES